MYRVGDKGECPRGENQAENPVIRVSTYSDGEKSRGRIRCVARGRIPMGAITGRLHPPLLTLRDHENNGSPFLLSRTRHRDHMDKCIRVKDNFIRSTVSRMRDVLDLVKGCFWESKSRKLFHRIWIPTEKYIFIFQWISIHSEELWGLNN